MLHACPLVAFVATSNPEESKAFYTDVLGLELVGDEPYALVFHANGTMLRVAKMPQFTPAPYTVLGWLVGGMEEVVAELAERGVLFEQFPGMPQDELGVCTFPGGVKVAWFKDPDGNMLSLTEFPTLDDASS